MKRIVALLLCLLFAGPALAEYEGYTLDFVSPSPFRLAMIGEDEFLAEGGDGVLHITHWKKHQVLRDLAYYPGGAVNLNLSGFLVRPDGAYRLLIRSRVVDAEGAESDQYSLYQWTEAGLERSAALPFSPQGNAPQCLGRYVYKMGWQSDGQWLLELCDFDGRLLLRRTSEKAVIALCEIGEEAFVLTMADHSLLCLDHGQEKWRTAATNALLRPMADGRGGVFTVSPVGDGTYTPMLLRHLDENGGGAAQAVLSGDQVIIVVSGCRAEKDGAFLLYGFAVANSRKIYTVFRLAVDERLRLLSSDIRSLSTAYGDYNPFFFLSPQGTLYVYTRSLRQDAGLPPVLIPFDQLPAAQNAVKLTWN